MNLADLREKRNKLMHDATAVSQEENQTAETRAKFDAIIADVDAVDADIKRAERVEKFDTESRSRHSHRPQPGDVEGRNAEIRSSFVNYLRTGSIENRDLTSAANGGVIVPQIFDPSIRSAQKSYGDIYDLVNVMKTANGDPIRLPLDNDTANGMQPVTVGVEVNKVDPPVSSVNLQVSPYTTGEVAVDMGLLQDSGFDLEAWLRDKFAKRFYRGVANAIFNGDNLSTNAITSAVQNPITSATTGKLSYQDLVNATAALDPAYQADAVWALSNAGLAAVTGIVDGNGRPLFLPDYGLATEGFAGTILGRRVKLVTQLPGVASGNTPVLLGDFKEGYTFRQVGDGLGILRLNERRALAYEVSFVGFARIGGVVTDAGTHPITGITIK